LHAMDGVFVHDYFADWPDQPIRQWAEQYYLRYQCLGIGVYYPPLFAGVEAVLFSLFGISVTIARLTVLLFVIGSLWLIYALGARLFSPKVGLAAAIFTLTNPQGIAWSRQVMLEWPATFFILLALWGYLKYLNRPTWKFGLVTGFAVLAAFLTKQTAVFVVLVIGVHAVFDRRGRLCKQRAFWMPLAAGLIGIGIYGWATAGLNQLAPQLIFGEPPFAHLKDWHNWLWYDARLPQILGWPLVIAGILAAGALIAVQPHEPAEEKKAGEGDQSPEDKESTAAEEALASYRAWFRPFLLPIVWVVGWWVICILMQAKEVRYIFFAVPGLVLLIAAGLGQLNLLNVHKRIGYGDMALLALVVMQAVYGTILAPAQRLPTMKDTVAYLADQEAAEVVLVDAVRDGQFIFDVRTSAKARGKIIAMRASKFLYSRAARTRYDYQAHVETPEQLRAFLDKYGIAYVVVEDRLPVTTDLSWDPPPRKMLRETLQDGELFERVHTQSLAGTHPDWREVNLDTYRYLKARQRREDRIEVRIPAMGKTLMLELPSPLEGNE